MGIIDPEAINPQNYRLESQICKRFDLQQLLLNKGDTILSFHIIAGI